MIDPIPCGCTEHPCNPSPHQTERYEVLDGTMLCAACFTLGHMPGHPDPVLKEYYDSLRRVMKRERGL